ncbi:MAG: proline dehydrogenase family protein [Acidobacteria bacterium]|nr:proline dehydrogenase family protein [Acidobacteriota bacterium]
MLRSAFLYLASQKRIERFLLALPGAQKVAGQFVAGDRLAQALGVVGRLNRRGILVTLDHLGENVQSLADAAAARDEYCRILDEIARQKLHSTISVKLTQLGLDLSRDICKNNLSEVTERAERTENFVQVDMESSAHTERTLAILTELHQATSAVGGVIQAYLYRSEDDVRQFLAQGIRLRLCKGAYKEPSSVAFPRKAEVDENFLRLMRLLLDSRLHHSIATHDPRMIDAACRYAREMALPKDSFEFQMLYGVRRDLQERLIADGYRLRVYVPFGKQWFPYFMRRLAERPANVWFVAKNLWR